MAYEQWKPVVGYEGKYEVSDHGAVRSLDRMVKGPNGLRRQACRVLSQSLTKGGYPHVGLRDGTRCKTWLVHTLVLVAFVGPRPDGMEACHGPAGKINMLTNLRWDTRTENNRDRVRHGTHHYSRRTHCDSGHELKPRRRGDRISRYCPACQRDAALARRSA